MLLVPPPLHLRPRHLGGRLGSRGDVAARQEQRRPRRRAGGDHPLLASQGQGRARHVRRHSGTGAAPVHTLII